MRFDFGNRALRDHSADGKALHLFKNGKKSEVAYQGEVVCSSYEWVQARDREGATRRAIVFHLTPMDHEPAETEPRTDAAVQPDLRLLRHRALEAAAAAPERPASEGRRTLYARSEAVRRYVLARAGGRCECCDSDAPFLRADGTPYLEPHHTRRLSDGGPDDPRWVAAICPTCHRRVHHGADGKALKAKLEEALARIESQTR